MTTIFSMTDIVTTNRVLHMDEVEGRWLSSIPACMQRYFVDAARHVVTVGGEGDEKMREYFHTEARKALKRFREDYVASEWHAIVKACLNADDSSAIDYNPRGGASGSEDVFTEPLWVEVADFSVGNPRYVGLVSIEVDSVHKEDWGSHVDDALRVRIWTPVAAKDTGTGVDPFGRGIRFDANGGLRINSGEPGALSDEIMECLDVLRDL
ncbi:MAG: hypothetical protein R5N75_10215 [Cutibacterium granulosum]|uniref:hypothetical protein n=1 Tax=Cutibacterium granulosum TaxID=33011 RepID=UPI002B22301B|nr:hypothetical protein [Cutibacterium granulosum]MEA5660468.1 hypothetical protein [Cutibacterium granulosum]